MATEREQVPDAYDDLLEEYRRATYLSDAGQVLGWDQQVTMPEGGTPARSKQSAALSAVQHDVLTGDGIAEPLDELDEGDLPQPGAAVVREVRREHERSARVPRDLVERISEEASNALPVWEEARAEDDWASFEPVLETFVELKREYAEHIDPDSDPYEVLFADYEPYLSLDHAERILERLRDELVPLIDAIRESDVDLALDFDGTYDEDDQMELTRDALDTLGYPWEHGRVDTASHPFSTGTQFDARVTTRFDESSPVSALGSTIHEFGHATYTLGLPEEEYGTPLGKNRGLSVHESQSRLWENHVGRSRAFVEGFLPRIEEQFPGLDLDAAGLHGHLNRVNPSNLIRVEADELTYHMHIILRFEIERDLISGDLDVSEVPAVWNEKMEEYLGVRPGTDSEGALQDIHWSHGSFGYFPTYSLGSVMAAQFFEAAQEDVEDLYEGIREGEFDALHDWLTGNVHRHGQRYETNELVERATGSEFTADAFLDYATTKFGDLYDL
ncbi:carboxypeptidase M32 [Salinirubellus sp. GCM10025818]|uniref:carboxypeptidase M32 n=1 Tax=Salinirubellus TaxID=2162630 RepID=UPI0030CB03B0